MLCSISHWVSHWEVRPLVTEQIRVSSWCVCISHVAVSCGILYPDQVPAWWCLDLDSFMLWVEWPTLTWTAGRIQRTEAACMQLAECVCLQISHGSCGTWFIKCMFPLHRPVIVIGGSSDRNQETAGAFQEFPQVIDTFTWIFFFFCLSMLH